MNLLSNAFLILGEIGKDNTGKLIIFLFALVTILFVLFAILLIVFFNLQKKYQAFMQGKDGKTLEDALLECIDHVDEIEAEQEDFEGYVREIIEKKGQKSLYKVGFERYDALEGSGGQLSFALALLDDSNSGILLNHIYYREGSMLYSKAIENGKCAQHLSEEEEEVLKQALATEI